MQNKRIVCFELNEVPFRIFDHFAKIFPNSSLGRIRNLAQAYETYTEDTGHLSPWITWPSLHRGVFNEDHEISDFGMDNSKVDKEFPSIWSILSKQGIKTGVFGSLHSYPLPKNLSDYSFFVPDTFAAGPECFPKKFEAFQDFNLKMAGLNGRNVTSGIALKEASRFLMAAPGLGLRARTIGKLVSQVAIERFNRDRVVRRRTSQVQIAFDFYLQALKREKPSISFFFTNHVASSLHRYWPAVFPEDYQVLNYDAEWLKNWSGEIPFAMYEVEHQLSQLMQFVEQTTDYVLMVGTSMGQAAVEGREKVNSQIVINNISRLMAEMGLSPAEWQKRPAMSPQYIVQIGDEKRDNFVQAIGAITVNGRSIDVEQLGGGVVRLELSIVNAKTLEVTRNGHPVDPRTFGFQNLQLQDAAGANAYHIPNGMLLIYDPSNPTLGPIGAREQISTLEIAPSILKNFGVPRPKYMRSALDL
jgi:hypothetical protein